ncbi:Sensor protein FixL [compost metagenome]
MQHLNTLVRLIREQAPLTARAAALCRLCVEQPGVSRSLYLGWSVVSQTYEPMAGGSLPPGPGDPLKALDAGLRAVLQQQPQLTMAELGRQSGWLAGRIRRSGMQQGMALSLALESGQDGLLLIETATDASAWLGWIGELLAGLVGVAGDTLPVAPLLSADPQPTLLLDASGQVLEPNEALRALLAESGVADCAALLPSNHAQLVRSCLQHGRAIPEVPSRVGIRQFLWSFIPEPAQQRVLARCRESTRQLHIERDAAKTRRLYRLIIENTTDLISRHSLDGEFIDASPASWTLLGYWPEELRGRHLPELMHPQDRERFAARRDALLQDGYLTETYRLRHRDGHYLWFETASRAIRETYTGAVVEVISVSRDMTERELREAQQRRHQDELAHTARLVTLGELASGIAHEINQPLAAVVNYAGASLRYLQSLDSNPDAAQKVAQGLSRITEHANHASEVIRRLRAFLRKGQRRMQALDLGELARESLRLCVWEAGHAKVTIEQALADNLPPVYADRVLLEQVLLNLLRNAIEANRERHAGEPSRIVIGSAAAPDGVRVWVEDSGAGLAGDELERIFTPFYTSKPEGLGLGLSMSRSIVEGFGGSLDAQPAEGGGLHMECRLPAGERGKRNA